MQPSLRIVAELPLNSLWDDAGAIPSERLRELSNGQIRRLLRAGTVRFVVADVGSRLEWIAEAKCFEYWKVEVTEHLADPGRQVSLDDFPGEYFYFASEWSSVGGRPVIVLERSH